MYTSTTAAAQIRGEQAVLKLGELRQAGAGGLIGDQLDGCLSEASSGQPPIRPPAPGSPAKPDRRLSPSFNTACSPRITSEQPKKKTDQTARFF